MLICVVITSNFEKLDCRLSHLPVNFSFYLDHWLPLMRVILFFLT
jgi:hypothetical protein